MHVNFEHDNTCNEPGTFSTRYSGARLIRMAYAQKIMRIIRACRLPEPILLSKITLWRVVSRKVMRIIQDVRISGGQIIRTIP